MKVHFKKTNLPFVYPFQISGGRIKSEQPALIVQLSIGNLVGVGEAPAITYYNITVEDMIAVLQEYQVAIEKFAFTDPERFWHYLHHLLPHNSSFLMCALDMAGWDLFGKMRQKPIYQLWGTEMNALPVTDYTIGIDTIDKMVGKIKAKPWPIYKIKLGTEDDIHIVQSLRAVTNSIFRVDVNGGWTLTEALNKIPLLKDLGVDMIEQPLPPKSWVDMQVLFKESVLPLIADESCVGESDVPNCKDHFHGINIKLTKCGGLTPALRMIKQARALNLKVMMGTMNESTIGSAAIAHFLPQLDFVDMDGPLLLKEDLAIGLNYNDGQIIMPNGCSGLGIRLI
ncbi:MAG: dipeptide epimerase [Phycisphaerales bacterium]|nr:dipeptide epimerase [Phycisphaerales bacterium]